MHETWHRVIKMYERESPEQYVDLKKLWHSYQNRKREVVAQFEAVKNAQNVTVDSIPLPSGDISGTGKYTIYKVHSFRRMNAWILKDVLRLTREGKAVNGKFCFEHKKTTKYCPWLPSQSSLMTCNYSLILIDAIPLPPAAAAPKAILKKPQSVLDALKPKTCPGIPSTVPPDLADYDDPDEGEGFAGAESNASDGPVVRKRTIRFDDGEDGEGEKEKVDPADLPPGTAEVEEDGPQVDDVQRRMLRMAGHADVDQYMKEMEEVHRKTQNEKQQDIQVII